MLKKSYSYIILITLLTACQISNQNQTTPSSDWKTIGKINNNNIIIAYDTRSFKIEQNIIRLTDKKTVVNMDKESYLDTPKFKTSIGEWEFDCLNRTYRLHNVKFWDNKGQLQAEYTFTPQQTKPSAIISNSPSEKLFNIACHRSS